MWPGPCRAQHKWGCAQGPSCCSELSRRSWPNNSTQALSGLWLECYLPRELAQTLSVGRGGTIGLKGITPRGEPDMVVGQPRDYFLPGIQISAGRPREQVDPCQPVVQRGPQEGLESPGRTGSGPCPMLPSPLTHRRAQHAWPVLATLRKGLQSSAQSCGHCGHIILILLLERGQPLIMCLAAPGSWLQSPRLGV